MGAESSELGCRFVPDNAMLRRPEVTNSELGILSLSNLAQQNLQRVVTGELAPSMARNCMHALRAIVLRRHWLAWILFVLAIGMKAMVPTGYMLGEQNKTLTFRICDGQGSLASTTIALPQSGKQDGGQSSKSHYDGICPQSTLSHAAMTGADPIQLALALVFILALGFAVLVFRPRAHHQYLRPPLRGPPALV